MNCPRHHTNLNPQAINEHQVDQCPECEGLWLDPGELETLRSRKPITPHVSRESSVGIGDHSMGASEELILYGLLGLF